MKKICIIILTLSAVSLSNAQIKQNDATKEEAITFLKNNIHYLNRSYGKRIVKFSIEGKYLFKRFENISPGSISLNLNDIKEVKITNYNAIFIYCYGDVVTEKFSSGVNRLNNVIRTDFIMNKRRIAERLTKALKQLAYWNKVEKSKSKF